MMSVTMPWRFTVDAVNKDGEFFDHAIRLTTTCRKPALRMALDVYETPSTTAFAVGKTFELALRFLDKKQTYRKNMDMTPFEAYDVVMHGKLFRIDTPSKGITKLYISCGGLMLCLEDDDDTRKTSALKACHHRIDSYVYVLIRHV